jgi:hypothetical protein
MLSVYELVSGDNKDLLLKSAEHMTNMTNSLKNFTKTTIKSCRPHVETRVLSVEC